MIKLTPVAVAVAAAFLGAFAFSTSAVAAPRAKNCSVSTHYRIVDLTPSEFLSSQATGINNLGHVVGWDDNGAFLYANGKLTQFSTFGHFQSFATGINVHDQIIGYVRDYDGVDFTYTGFLLSGGTLTWLPAATDLPNGTANSIPYAINDHGVIVGKSWTTVADVATHPTVATRWVNGVPVDFSASATAADVDTSGVAINDAGKVVATYKDTSGLTSVLLEPLRPRVTLATNVRPTAPTGINVDGVVVGTAGDPESAYVWSKGHLSTVPPPTDIPPTFYTGARSINGYDQIVGFSAGDGGQQYAYLWHGSDAVDLNLVSAPIVDGYPVLYDATGIDSHGRICGEMFADGTLITHAFLLEPTGDHDGDGD